MYGVSAITRWRFDGARWLRRCNRGPNVRPLWNAGHKSCRSFRRLPYTTRLSCKPISLSAYRQNVQPSAAARSHRLPGNGRGSSANWRLGRRDRAAPGPADLAGPGRLASSPSAGNWFLRMSMILTGLDRWLMADYTVGRLTEARSGHLPATKTRNNSALSDISEQTNERTRHWMRMRGSLQHARCFLSLGRRPSSKAAFGNLLARVVRWLVTRAWGPPPLVITHKVSLKRRLSITNRINCNCRAAAWAWTCSRPTTMVTGLADSTPQRVTLKRFQE